MIAGKKDLLKTQFLAADLWLIGMQETRLPTSAVLPDRDFLMLNVAADDQGHHGCALWINLHHAFAHDGEQAHKIPQGPGCHDSLFTQASTGAHHNSTSGPHRLSSPCPQNPGTR